MLGSRCARSSRAGSPRRHAQPALVVLRRRPGNSARSARLPRTWPSCSSSTSPWSTATTGSWRPSPRRPGRSPTRGCAVTNTFGERFWIAGGPGPGRRPAPLHPLHLQRPGEGRLPADTSLLLRPTAPRRSTARPRGGAPARRDGQHGLGGRAGRAPARRLRDPASRPAARPAPFRTPARRAAPAGSPQAADIRYRVMTTCPENSIPFMPAHGPAPTAVRLQRAAMPRVIPNAGPVAPARIEPLTASSAPASNPPRHPYFLHEEEEVPASSSAASPASSGPAWCRWPRRRLARRPQARRARRGL